MIKQLKYYILFFVISFVVLSTTLHYYALVMDPLTNYYGQVMSFSQLRQSTHVELYCKDNPTHLFVPSRHCFNSEAEIEAAYSQ